MRPISALTFACLIGISSLAGADGQSDGSVTWIESRCAAYRGDYCRVPFHVALLQPQTLAGKSMQIQLRGYLLKTSGGFLLFADKSAAQRGWRTDALRIQQPTSPAIADSLAALNQKLVSLRGRILLESPDHDEYWASFTLEEVVIPAPTLADKLK